MAIGVRGTVERDRMSPPPHTPLSRAHPNPTRLPLGPLTSPHAIIPGGVSLPLGRCPLYHMQTLARNPHYGGLDTQREAW